MSLSLQLRLTRPNLNSASPSSPAIKRLLAALNSDIKALPRLQHPP
eukprot:CAMPEP_0115327626 /NCGR_PEP_ID=MMETSP0270-20121206/84238_1 /TAXON_ID=71861 /ORGANISM="Scrippsiella trochoidea, Strain CCMP3099" /LENGTH=45 /DNA_ID= /DNA_START= /DNA_END= /DNA_ORIENTATION=